MRSEYENGKASIEETCNGGPLKKGPWTSAEDEILVDYVTKHGEGNWNAVQKHSGLWRCGKSCRLRWANHLRPDLRKGAFTPQEEDRIIKLHAKIGNKWARMAAELPGRTDNEIKNYWNTRIKRLQRAGLPIYPPEIHVQAPNESQQSDNMVTCHNGDTHHSDASQNNGFDIPDVEFKNLELSQELLNCPSTLLDIPTSSLLQKSAGPSQSYGFMFPSLHPRKRLRETETRFNNGFPSFEQYEDDTFGRFAPSSYDPDLNINLQSQINIPGSHAFINGNYSSSEPLSVAMKLELPSLQLSASQAGSLAACSSLPSLDTVDTLIQSPLSEHTLSNCPSPRNNGLLEAIVYESKSMKDLKNKSSRQISESSVMAGDGVESSSLNAYEMKWDGCGDPMSPLSQSAASVFVDHTPVVSGGSSSDELQSAETLPGYQNKLEADDWVSSESLEKNDDSFQLEYMMPDALLDSFWLGHCITRRKDQSITADVGALLNEDFNYEYKQDNTLHPESNRTFCPMSSSWDDISAVCQFSKED